MKKITVFLLLLVSVIALSACQKVTYEVSFNSNGGTDVATITVNEGETAAEPAAPEKEGYIFTYWYEEDELVPFDFSQAINANVSLQALWVMSDAEMMSRDIAAFEEVMFDDPYLLDLPYKLSLHETRVTWDIDATYISEEGVILTLLPGESPVTETVTATYTLNDETLVKTYEIVITAPTEVVIAEERDVDFENLTTEYDVANGSLTLYFEENGNVPYVKVEDFMDLLDGFIDPEVVFTYTTTGNVLEIHYQYYDEDEDETYDLTLTFDADENTIICNDPAFYWAYVYSTETNYGRHIEYDLDNPDADFDEGENIVYDLDQYNMDIVVHDGEVVIPYYMANQLLAGSSYYNVYYNYDGLYGIYSLPESGSMEMRTIRRSTMNREDIPGDILVHTFYMLAFDLDNLYGLKDIMNVDTYYDLLFENFDDLMNPDPEDFDYAVREILLKGLDEPHTSYGYPSYFNSSSWSGPETNNLSFYGTRFTQWYYNGLFAVDDEIGAKWGENPDGGWNAYGVNRPFFWFLDTEKTTVMLSLDDFYTSDIEEDVVFNQSIVDSILEVDDASMIVPAISQGNKFFFYNSSSESNRILEVLVKGVDQAYVDTYEAALLSAGFTYVYEDTNDDEKENGYYTITTGSGEEAVEYMLQVAYDVDYSLFYVSVTDQVPATYDATWPVVVDIKDTVQSDSAVFMEMQLDLIFAESSAVTDIILDLSWNTGGNIGALYRIVGFITDDPFRVSSIDGDTGGNGSYYVTIPGIDAVQNVEWSLLITPVTFSAANEMATIFMSNDLGPIIGVTSGGGACSITPILLPNGTAFTTSSNNISAYRTGSGTEADPYVYHNTEFGITPDYPIEIGLIYDETTLLDILAND